MPPAVIVYRMLTHWSRVMHICVNNLTIIGPHNGLLPSSEILIKIHTYSFKKMHLKRSSAKWWPFCIDLNVLMIGTVYLSRYFRVLLWLATYRLHAYISGFFSPALWWSCDCSIARSDAGLNDTVKPVYNDHLSWYFSAFWSSSRWPRAT